MAPPTIASITLNMAPTDVLTDGPEIRMCRIQVADAARKSGRANRQ